MIKRILDNSLKNLKKNWALITALCFILVLVGAIVFSFDLMAFGIGLIFCLPFIFMPVFFAIQVAIFGLRQNANPSWRLFLRFFASYFKNTFRGCYHYILMFLSSVLIMMIFSNIFTYIAEAVCYSVFPNFSQILEELMNSLSNLEINRSMELINGVEISTFLYISYLPSVGLGLIYFFSMLSFSSFYVYFKIENSKLNPQFAKVAYRVGIRQLRYKIYGNFLALNWPIYILLIGGFIGGTCLSYYLGYNFMVGISLGIILSLGAMLFYLPFYFSNNESIYLAYHDILNKSPDIAKKMVMDSLQSQIRAMNKNFDINNQETNNNQDTENVTNKDSQSDDNSSNQ